VCTCACVFARVRAYVCVLLGRCVHALRVCVCVLLCVAVCIAVECALLVFVCVHVCICLCCILCSQVNDNIIGCNTLFVCLCVCMCVFVYVVYCALK